MTMMRTSDGLSTTINDLATKILKAGMNSKSEKKKTPKKYEPRTPSFPRLLQLARPFITRSFPASISSWSCRKREKIKKQE